MPQKEKTPLAYTTHLSDLAGSALALSKGERTRLRLKGGAARLLGSKDYHSMQMLDISRAAGLSNGAVYQYFENKKAITVEVLGEFLEYVGAVMENVSLADAPYEGFFQAYLRYVEVYRQNSGLMRCLRQLGDTIPEIGAIMEKSYSDWSRKLAHIVLKESPDRGGGEERTILTVRALALMGNEFLYDLFVRQSPALVKFDKSPEAVASMLAAIFHRAIYGRDPVVKFVGKQMKPGFDGEKEYQTQVCAS